MALLISQQEVVNIAINEKNFDLSLITDADIEGAELIHLQPRIGQDLYKALQEGKHPELLTKLRTPLAYFVKLVVLPAIAVKVANSGQMVGFNQHSNSASKAERLELREATRKIAEAHLNKVLEYLVENRKNFPEFTPTGVSRGTYTDIIL